MHICIKIIKKTQKLFEVSHSCRQDPCLESRDAGNTAYPTPMHHWWKWNPPFLFLSSSPSLTSLSRKKIEGSCWPHEIQGVSWCGLLNSHLLNGPHQLGQQWVYITCVSHSEKLHNNSLIMTTPHTPHIIFPYPCAVENAVITEREKFIFYLIKKVVSISFYLIKSRVYCKKIKFSSRSHNYIKRVQKTYTP